METFSFNPPKKLFEGGKWLLAVTSFEATNSVFNIADERKSFSNTIPGHWFSRGTAETMNRLRELLRLRAQNDFELYVEEYRKRGNEVKTRENDGKLSDLDTRKNEVIEELKNVEYNEPEDMVFRMELLYTEIEYILDRKVIDASTIG